MEKIAREFRNMGRSRTQVEEMIKPIPSPTSSEFTDKPKALRRIRSLGNLGNLRSVNGSAPTLSTPPTDTPAFDVDEMRRQRLIYEANAAKSASHSPTV